MQPVSSLAFNHQALKKYRQVDLSDKIIALALSLNKYISILLKAISNELEENQLTIAEQSIQLFEQQFQRLLIEYNNSSIPEDKKKRLNNLYKRFETIDQYLRSNNLLKKHRNCGNRDHLKERAAHNNINGFCEDGKNDGVVKSRKFVGKINSQEQQQRDENLCKCFKIFIERYNNKQPRIKIPCKKELLEQLNGSKISDQASIIRRWLSRHRNFCNDVLELDFSRLGLKHLPLEFFLYFRNLQELDLYNNELESLPAEIQNLKKLKKLDMSFNKFKYKAIMLIVSQLSGLKYFFVSRNNLKSLPNLNHLSELDTLDISDNQISDFSEQIKDLKKLKLIYVINCNLSEKCKQDLEDNNINAIFSIPLIINRI